MKNNTGLWRQTPPAIFPPILGLFGVGLAWRRAVPEFSVPPFLGELILGAVSLLFIFALTAYLGKVVRRPGALVDDLRILPGRAGLSTATMAGMLFAAVLVPYSPGFARLVLGLSLAAHLAIATIAVFVLWGAPLAQRRMTPVWHLTFVGFIVGPVAGVALGWVGLSEFILILSIAAAIAIWGGLVVGMVRAPVPAPLRPTLAIHLSPAALLGIVSALLGHGQMALGFGWLSIAILALLLVRLPYILEAGFSPFWGAFTFPLAAFSNLMLILAQDGNVLFRVLGGAALVAATIIVPMIAFKVLKMWSSGPLAVKTNASKV